MPDNIRAGRIRGNALNGLCERVCIEVKRVYDGCRQTFSNQNFTFAVTQIPPQAVPPFVFVEASSQGQMTVENVSVTDAEGRLSRITGEIVMNVTVTLRDSLGNTYGGVGVVRMGFESLLRVPEATLVPYSIEVWGALRSRIGSFIDNGTVSMTACVVFITKVIVPTDILVPSYGNCVYPECDASSDACNALVELSVFPD